MPARSRAHALADFLIDQAAWREAKAREFPGDLRNKRAAEGLARLATYVKALRVDDPRIRALEQLGAFDPVDGRLLVGEQSLRWASSFRFNRPDEGFEPFLGVFIELLQVDRERVDGRPRQSPASDEGMIEIVIQVHDPERGSVRKKFVGRAVVEEFVSTDAHVAPGVRFTVYETRGGRYAVHRRGGEEERLDVFDDLAAMAGHLPADLVAKLREEPPLEVLDI